MKRIGVLGGTGEIGKRIVKILEDKYTILGSYRTNKPGKEIKSEFIQLDISDTENLRKFCEQCDVIVNCAGASFINGERIARISTELHIPIVDPSGESFLEDKIDNIKKENIFVLSSGYFPGMTGLLMRYICEKFDKIKELSGMSVSNEIPSRSAIEDFILTNIAGFGVALNYYENGEYKRDEREFLEEIENQKFKLQNYYTVELDRVVKTYLPDKANWYNVGFGNEIMQKMQEAVIKFGMKNVSKEFAETITEIIDMFQKNTEKIKPFNYIRIEANGINGDKQFHRKAEIVNDYSSEISAVIAAYAVDAILNSKLDNGIYYAMDIIDMEKLIEDLTKFNIKLDITEKMIGDSEVEYEEGAI
jgi:uncharacterized protein YsxB (DUF464 family)